MITREQQVKIISRNVKAAFQELGLKVGVFAEVANLATSTVNRILEGESLPGSGTINKLAAAFFCEPGDLLPDLEELKARKEDSAWAKKQKLKAA